MKFVVLGAAGQLGRDLCPLLAGEVTALDRSTADLTRPDMLRATLTALRPDCVLNCAAYNFVDRAETESDMALAVNGWGQRCVSCRDLPRPRLHPGPFQHRLCLWARPGSPNALHMRRCARAGQRLWIEQIGGRIRRPGYSPTPFWWFRTCGLYGLWGAGGKGGNFVETMLRLAGQGKPLRIVADQFCTPSFTADLAAAVAELVKTDRYGLHHLVNADSCSWFEFARAIFDISQVKADLAPITSAEWKSAARRPAYSVLTCQTPLRPWREALAAYLLCRTSGVYRQGGKAL